MMRGALNPVQQHCNATQQPLAMQTPMFGPTVRPASMPHPSGSISARSSGTGVQAEELKKAENHAGNDAEFSVLSAVKSHCYVGGRLHPAYRGNAPSARSGGCFLPSRSRKVNT